MAEKRIILLDWDDSCCDFVSHLLELYNDKYNDNKKISDITDWQLDRFIPKCTEEELFDIVLETSFYENIPLYDGVYETLKEYDEFFDFQFVTSVRLHSIEGRSKHFKNKLNHFAKRLPFINIDNFTVIHNKYILRGLAMVDDKISNLKSPYIRYPLLYTKPWNEENHTYNRVCNWDDIRDKFEFFRRLPKIE